MKRVFCVLVAAATLACAGHLSIKQTGTASVQTVDALLSHAQDFEKSQRASLHLDDAASPAVVKLCTPHRADGSETPNPTTHEVFGCVFRKAFAHEATAARALEQYKPGDPVPTDLVLLQQDLDTGIAAAKIVVPGQTDLLSAVQAVADEVLHVISHIRAAIVPTKPGA